MAIVTDARHRDLAMQEVVAKLVAGGETVASNIDPRTFIDVFAQLDAVRAGDDQSFFRSHFLMAANVEVKSLLERRQSKFKHVHDREADVIFSNEDGADLLCEIP